MPLITTKLAGLKLDVEFSYYPAQTGSWESPGCDEEIEINTATFITPKGDEIDFYDLIDELSSTLDFDYLEAVNSFDMFVLEEYKRQQAEALEP